MTNEVAEDLKQSLDIDDLDDGEQLGIIFQDLTNVVSPGRRMTKLYSMENGKEVDCMQYRRREWLRKRNADGTRRFTANKAEAPEYIPGTARCIFADDSEERLNGELTEAGLANRRCSYKHGESSWSADEHAKKKHRSEWRSWESYLDKKERDEIRAEQRRTTEAMMAMAGKTMPAPVVVEPTPNGESSVVVTPTEVMDYEEFVKEDAEAAFVADWHAGMNVKALRQYAIKVGVELHPPSKYFSRDDLIEMIEGK